MPVVSSLFVYPIKSCQGISVPELAFDKLGPCFDRRYMLVDMNDQFLTQRTTPALASVETRLREGRVQVLRPDMPVLTLPDDTRTRQRRSVKVWTFEGKAIDVGDGCAEWFSKVLDIPCRLVKFADNIERRVNQSQAQVAFADGYPVLLTTVESLGELNRRLSTPIPMNRFRPNVVVRDNQPFEEDRWSQVAVLDRVLDLVKPCERCKITTINQSTLTTNKEPLATLATFRRGEHGVLFGQNCIPRGTGSLRVGDELRTIAKTE